MGITRTNHLPDAGFFFMRQALVEAALMSEKRSCDAVYVATLTEELRNIEKKIVAFERTNRSPSAESSITSLAAPEDLPDADWIHRKARELELRLRKVEESVTENGGSSNGNTRTSPVWRAVPRYPKTVGSAGNRKAYKGESKI